jgi:nucleotide-binding universal stress UspA family protein
MFKRILWATDFSEHATHARAWAIQCAQCSGGKLFALNVTHRAPCPVMIIR